MVEFIELEGARYVPERTCEVVGTISWTWTAASVFYEHSLSCGHVITSVDKNPPYFCEECGARVKEVDE